MSTYQPNITWQAGDGTWSLGIYPSGSDDEPNAPFEFAFVGGVDSDSVTDACYRRYGNLGVYNCEQDAAAAALYDPMVAERVVRVAN